MIPREKAPARHGGFSLIEVIAAVVIFSIGMVAVLGLFAPVTKSVATVSEAESAARMADSVRARLQALPFDSALALIELPADVRKNDADGAYNPADGTKHPTVLFGKRNGEVGLYNGTLSPKGWYDATLPKPLVVADADKFFEIDLIRNETLSPKTADGTAALIAYTMRVRWPAFVMTSATTAVQNGQTVGGSVPFDQSRKQVMFFTGSIAR